MYLTIINKWIPQPSQSQLHWNSEYRLCLAIENSQTPQATSTASNFSYQTSLIIFFCALTMTTYYFILLLTNGYLINNKGGKRIKESKTIPTTDKIYALLEASILSNVGFLV